MKIYNFIVLVHLTNFDTQNEPLDLSIRTTNIDDLLAEASFSKSTVKKLNRDERSNSSFSEVNQSKRKYCKTNYLGKTSSEIFKLVQASRLSFNRLKCKSSKILLKYENLVRNRRYNLSIPNYLNILYTNALFSLISCYKGNKFQHSILVCLKKHPVKYYRRICYLRKELNKPLDTEYKEIGKAIISKLKTYVSMAHININLITDDIKLVKKLMSAIKDLDKLKLKLIERIDKIETLLPMIYPKLFKKKS